MKLTIPILIIVAIGLLSGCALGMHEISVSTEYFWNDSGTILTINYTLFNNGRTNLYDVVVTFGADLTTNGNNYYGDTEDLSVSAYAEKIYQNTSESDFVTIATGGLPVHGVGIIKIGLDNPPDNTF